MADHVTCKDDADAAPGHENSRHASEAASPSDDIGAERPEKPPIARTPSKANLARKTPKKLHGRSQSHAKVPTRASVGAKPNLNRSKSTDAILRGVKRNNRSHTKLASLLPLTKTLLNGSISRAVAGLSLQPLTKTLLREVYKTTLNPPNLAKTDLNQLIKSNKSNSSLKGQSRSSGSLKGMLQPLGGLKSSAKRGKAILRLNEDTAYDEYEDFSDDSEHEMEQYRERQRAERLRAEEGEREREEREREEREREEKEDTQNDEKAFDGADDNGSGKTDRAEDAEELAKEPIEGGPTESPKTNDETIHEHESPKTNDETIHAHESPKTNDETIHEHEMRREDDAFGKSSDVNEHYKSENAKDFSENGHEDKRNGYGSKNGTGGYDIAKRNELEELLKNMYGGSFLLSQSTGMTRKFDQNIHKDDGMLYKPHEPRQEIGPKVTRENATQGSYHADQSIISNLLRTDSKYMSSLKKQSQRPVQRPLPGQSRNIQRPQNFQSYLSNQTSQGQNIETRTQQRLWLQRENSLMDLSANLDSTAVGNFSNLSINKLMFAHNYNGSSTNVNGWNGERLSGVSQSGNSPSSLGQSPGSNPSDLSVSINNMFQIQNGQNSIQLRTEFERLNREYVNVRRHLNPVAEMLSRMEKSDDSAPKKKKNAYGANSYKEFAPHWEKKAEEIGGQVNRLWQEALLLTSLRLHERQSYS